MNAPSPGIVRSRRGFIAGAFCVWEWRNMEVTEVPPAVPRVWANRDFVRLWIGQTISRFGSHVGVAGVGYAALLTLRASPEQMGLLGALGMLPALLVGLFAGVWVDRLRKRPLLIGADLGRAAVLCTVPITAFAGALRIEQLYVVAAFMGVLDVLFVVADPAYLPTLVAEAQLVEGNSKIAVSSSMAEVAGPALAGTLVQLLTAPFAILLDAVSYLVSAACLGRIRAREPEPKPHEPGRVLRDILDGLRAVWNNPVLRAVAVSAATAQFFGSFYMVLYALYMIRVLHQTPLMVGVGVGIGGIGALVGAFVAERVVRKLGLGRGVIAATLAGALTQPFFLLAGAPPNLVFAGIIFMQFFGDVAWTHYDVIELTIRQTAAPPQLLGRVTASMHVLARALTPLAAILAGTLASRIGPTHTLTIAWFGILASVVPLLLSPVRTLGRQRPA
jgi:MFS family permease